MKEPKGLARLVITSSGDWLVCVTGLGMLTTFLTKYLYAAAQSVGWQHTDSFPLISDDNSSPPQWEKVSDINSWLFMEWNLSDKSRKEMSGRWRVRHTERCLRDVYRRGGVWRLFARWLILIAWRDKFYLSFDFTEIFTHNAEQGFMDASYTWEVSTNLR